MPDLPFGLKCARQPEPVLQNDRINTAPALHAAETLDIVVARILQVVRPLTHEQALTPDAGSRRKLLADWKRPNGKFSVGLLHHSVRLRLCEFDYPFHDSVSLLFGSVQGLCGSEFLGEMCKHSNEHIGFKDIGHWERPQRPLAILGICPRLPQSRSSPCA